MRRLLAALVLLAPLLARGQAHSVTLVWQAPAPNGDTNPVVGYNVFRQIYGITNTYEQVNLQLVPQTSYVDLTVTSGMSYQYYVDAQDSTGAVSSPSNTVVSTVPLDSPVNFLGTPQ